MYFQDLTPCTYWANLASPKLLAVGWLDGEHEFPKGHVPERVTNRILELCVKEPVNRTRGREKSPFFKVENGVSVRYPYPVQVKWKGETYSLGSAEILVFGKSGRCYAAPNLIYHYIKDCGYLPPQEFLSAVSQPKIMFAIRRLVNQFCLSGMHRFTID